MWLKYTVSLEMAEVVRSKYGLIRDMVFQSNVKKWPGLMAVWLGLTVGSLQNSKRLEIEAVSFIKLMQQDSSSKFKMLKLGQGYAFYKWGGSASARKSKTWRILGLVRISRCTANHMGSGATLICLARTRTTSASVRAR